MTTILTIIYGIIIIGFLALVHETGHFIAAKLSGIGVEEFSIGFGPTIVQKRKGERAVFIWDKKDKLFVKEQQLQKSKEKDEKFKPEPLEMEESNKGTLYKICLLPILGYVKIKGMEGDFDAPDGFFKKGLFKRFITLFMGPFTNFITAVVIFAVVFSSFGNPLAPSTVVSSVSLNSPAYVAGIMPGDKIIAINGQSINSWKDMTDLIHNSNGNLLQVTVLRKNNNLTLNIAPKKDSLSSQWVIGIFRQGEKYNPLLALWEGIKWTGNVLYKTFTLLPTLFTKQGFSSLTGPIGIVAMTGEAASGGFANLLWFTAFISIALGFTNLLPIPALDGSWIVLVLWEAITKKPVPPEKQAGVQSVGFVAVLGLMFLISIKDILRLFGR